jgi:hypothetical protein
MKRFITIGLFLLIFCEGCEEIFDFPEKRIYEKYPVIEALFTDKLDHQRIRVSFSTQFEDSISCLPVEDALVKIADIDGDTAIFQHVGNGWYTSNEMVALPNKEYKLLVQIDTTLYQSTSVMETVNGLDSITYSYQQNSNSLDFSYHLKMYAGITDPDNPKYYQCHIYKNKELITKGNNMIMSSDYGTTSFNGVEISSGFSIGDTLDVELYSLTKEVFDYYVYIYSDLLFNNNNNDMDFRTNPPLQFSPQALGYFQISSVSSKTLIIK